MKPIDEVKTISAEKQKDEYRLAMIMLIQQQIEAVGKLMENHQDLVKSPLSYNLCAGLISQLKTHCYAAFSGLPATIQNTSFGDKPIVTEIKPEGEWFFFPSKEL